jgi:hypothetical protein
VTFAARGLLVSLAFFAVVYCSLSTLVVLAWSAAERRRERHGARSADLLFGLRMFSFVVSGVVTSCFTFPSFWLMEKASFDEEAGTFVLAACALVILGAGAIRVLRDQSRTARAVKEWLLGTSGGEGGVTKPALGAAHGAPALILVGIRKPRVMISDAAASVLSDDELQVAIRHELGHRRSWDNLKKVLISATPFPWMNSLEKSWREASELAADDAAVANRQEALDLAAALIKLSRSPKQSPEPALASGLVCGLSSVRLRVERLLEWRAAGRGLRRSWMWPWTVVVLVGMTVAIASHYGATLVLTHRLTELLVP